jgi:polyisoprenoid-binding protein YceI
MKPFTLVLLLCLAPLAAWAQPASKTYTALPATTTVSWTGHAHVGSYAPTGSLKLSQGSFALVDNRIQSGKVVIDMTSLTTADGELQAHLKNADFFDVAKYPVCTMVLAPSKAGQAKGMLTIKGVTKRIAFPVTITKTTTGVRVKGICKIDRTVFGIKYNSASFFKDLGDYAIGNQFELAFDLQAEPAQ